MDTIKEYLQELGFVLIDTEDNYSVFEGEHYFVRLFESAKYHIAPKHQFKNWDVSMTQNFSIDENRTYEKIFTSLLKPYRPYNELKSGSICHDCAMEFSLSWPKGHCATFWLGECSQCGKEASCCSTGDYNFKGKRARGFRD